MRTLVVLTLALTVTACGDPDGKLNSDPNVQPNNLVNNVNGSTNNEDGGGGTIEPADYDQSCGTDTDCALINSGDACGCKVCPDAAINASALNDYQSDLTDAMCGAIDCPAIGCGDEFLPYCNPDGGSCEARVAEYVSVEDLDNTCSEDADCAPVFAGEMCSECRCPNAVVNVAEVEEVASRYTVACSPPAVDCSCAAPLIRCDEGLCVLE